MAGLLTFVEGTLKCEFRRAPSRPIYLVGESLGGCLGLALAANNPDIDLVLVLVNPGMPSTQIILMILTNVYLQFYIIKI
jgi:pimeloyl-ACP methyl ester carboxylesterase